eukprot:GFUD01042471.1.p1 GENE.GFUD01042471.1~~GFUD01042471.1.p1  ORF type:complete len:687 (-),score=183.83 GFUD01042471.1:48-2108(-)
MNDNESPPSLNTLGSGTSTQCSSLGGWCTCSLCNQLSTGGATGCSSLDNMSGTFIDLSKCAHSPNCPCPDCKEVCSALHPLCDAPYFHCDSLQSHLPGPGKVWGWLVPGKPTSPPIRTRELVGEERFTVGREQYCKLVFEEFMFPGSEENLQCNKTSRVQFEVFIENSRPYIQDKSMNGTFVNGVKLNRDDSKRLNHGDVISILQVDLEMFCYLDEFQMMSRNYPLRIITKYLVGNIVGSGSYSVVRKGFTRNDFTPVAMKFIRKNQLPIWLTGSDNLMSEVDILQQLHHPCITKVLDVVETTFELVIVMEYAEGGELHRQVKMDTVMGRLSEETAKFQFYQICHTIAYLHSKNICHRDLKLANILLMEPNSRSLLKVSDFGVSKIWSASNMLESMVGTPAFMAPEVLALECAPHLSYTCKSDCWSLGVVLYLLLCGNQPFIREFFGQSVHMQIMSGDFNTMTGGIWDCVSPQAKDLVSKLLVVEPDDRLSAALILQHPWFTEDITTCRRARNKMFGTQDSVGGSVSSGASSGAVTSDNTTGGDSGVGSKTGSKEELSGRWREPLVPSDGEEVVEDIRARLRPRVPRNNVQEAPTASELGTPPRRVRTPGRLGMARVGGGTPVKGTLTLLKGTKRKDGAESKQVAFLLPGKRRRRNSEVRQYQPLGVEAGVGKEGKKGRRRRKTGM